jgi:hypothetical protein
MKSVTDVSEHLLPMCPDCTPLMAAVCALVFLFKYVRAHPAEHGVWHQASLVRQPLEHITEFVVNFFEKSFQAFFFKLGGCGND